MTVADPGLWPEPGAPHAAACRCPACGVEAAATLLRTGRPGMALRVLEPLPAAVRGAVAEADRAGFDRGRCHVPQDLILKARRELLGLNGKVEGLRIAAGVLERELDARHRELRKVEERIEARRVQLARLRAQARAVRVARPDPEGKSMRNHERLAAALAAGTLTAARVAALLRVREADVGPIAAGRVRLATSAWRRVMGEIGR